jgi:hypothetical protein
VAAAAAAAAKQSEKAELPFNTELELAKQFSSTYREANDDFSVIQPYARHCND